MDSDSLPLTREDSADRMADLQARLKIAEGRLMLISAKLDTFAVSINGKKYSKMSTEELATDGLAAMITLHDIGEVLARKGGA